MKAPNPMLRPSLLRACRIFFLFVFVAVFSTIFAILQAHPWGRAVVDIAATILLLAAFTAIVITCWLKLLKQPWYITLVSASGGLALLACSGLLVPDMLGYRPKLAVRAAGTALNGSDAATAEVGVARQARRVWALAGIIGFAALLYLVKFRSKLWFGVIEVTLAGAGATALNPKFLKVVSGDGKPLDDTEPWLIMVVATYAMVKGFENISDGIKAKAEAKVTQAI